MVDENQAMNDGTALRTVSISQANGLYNPTCQEASELLAALGPFIAGGWTQARELASVLYQSGYCFQPKEQHE